MASPLQLAVLIGALALMPISFAFLYTGYHQASNLHSAIGAVLAAAAFGLALAPAFFGPPL